MSFSTFAADLAITVGDPFRSPDGYPFDGPIAPALGSFDPKAVEDAESVNGLDSGQTVDEYVDGLYILLHGPSEPPAQDDDVTPISKYPGPPDSQGDTERPPPSPEE